MINGWCGPIGHLMQNATAVAAPPLRSNAKKLINASALYDALYNGGYHNDTNGSRAVDLLPFVVNIAKLVNASSVLDIGCSHGWAVNQLWTHGLRASGVDVSTVAVALAVKVRGEPAGSCVQPCFVKASATALPWANNSFDVVMSSDVLEHIETIDVPLAVRELSRVARKALVLKISRLHDKVDSIQRKAISEAVGEDIALPRDLHLTVQRPEFWIKAFQEIDPSWMMQANLAWPQRADNKTQMYRPRRPWMCCSFALVRKQFITARDIAWM